MSDESVRDLVKAVQRNYDRVFIAGGYALDLHRGVTPKDIDVFVIVPEYSSVGENQVLDIGEYKFLAKSSPKTKETYPGTCVYWAVVNKQIVELIFVRDREIRCPEELVKYFDFDIAEAWIKNLNSENWTPVLSTEAARALNNKCITYKKSDPTRKILGASVNKTKRDARIARYKEKFPGFKMVEKL